MKSITITLPLPSPELSPNFRGHWSTKALAIRSYRQRAFIEARRALDGRDAPRWVKASAKVEFRYGDARRRDPDNSMASLKSAFDGIADAGIVANDSGIWPERPTFSIDAANPRVVITLIEEIAESIHPESKT